MALPMSIYTDDRIVKRASQRKCYFVDNIKNNHKKWWNFETQTSKFLEFLRLKIENQRQRLRSAYSSRCNVIFFFCLSLWYAKRKTKVKLVGYLSSQTIFQFDNAYKLRNNSVSATVCCNTHVSPICISWNVRQHDLWCITKDLTVIIYHQRTNGSHWMVLYTW